MPPRFRMPLLAGLLVLLASSSCSCEPPSAVDPCASCADDEVCVSGACRASCSEENDCGPGEPCLATETGQGYCAPAPSTVSVPVTPGVQESTGGGVRLRGALHPYTGTSTGAGVTLTPPIE